MAEKNEKTPRQNNSPPDKDNERANITRSYQKGWAYAETGFQYGMAIIICLLIGSWLDSKLGTGNILMITGVLIGAAAGFIGLLKQLNVLNLGKKSDRNKKV